MNEGKIVVTDAELKLTHGFYKWSRFDISNSATQLRVLSVHSPKHGKQHHLDDAHIRFLACLIDGDFGYAFNPVLNCVRDMRHNLRGLNTSLINSKNDALLVPFFQGIFLLANRDVRYLLCFLVIQTTNLFIDNLAIDLARRDVVIMR